MRLDWHWDGDSGDRLYSVLAGFSCSECSDPSKLDRLRLEFSATIPWLGEERNCNEGIEVFGRAEGVHHQAG